MREAEEGKGLRFVLATPLSPLSRKAAKLAQPRLVGMPC
jgi:hypothetical protein